MPDMNPYDPIVIQWVDIHVTNEAHDPDEYIESFEPCVRRTTGFFLGIRCDHLFTAETDDRQAKTDYLVERINAFPLSVIKSIIKPHSNF
jgi:hypothetical protein